MQALRSQAVAQITFAEWNRFNTSPYMWQREALLNGDVVLIRAYLTDDKTTMRILAFEIVSGELVARHRYKPFTDPKLVDAFVKQNFDGTFGDGPPGATERGRKAEGQESPRWVYMATTGANNSLDVLDPATFEGVTSLIVEPHLFGGMAFSPDGRRLYVTLWRSTTATPAIPAQIYVIDTKTNQIINRIALSREMLPSKPVVSRDGKLLYFADSTQGLVVVDLEAGLIIDQIPAARAGSATNQFATLSLSPDGGLICVSDSAGLALLDTRTRTFIARLNITLPNRSIAPVFDPTGKLIYVIDRRTAADGLAVSLVSFDTSELTEVSRTRLPSTFDPYHLVMVPDGLSIAMDGFLRVSNQPLKGVFILVDATTNAVVLADDTVESSIGSLGVVMQ